jgi:NTP pyrophosphatase (non-canonical NTP hydrolase)
MTFNEYQKKIAVTDRSGDAQRLLGHPINYYMYGLVGEMGEVFEKTKKLFRDHKGVPTEEFKTAVTKEVGDVLWYLTRYCSFFDINLDDVAVGNLEKLLKRLEEGKIHGEGDDR